MASVKADGRFFPHATPLRADTILTTEVPPDPETTLSCEAAEWRRLGERLRSLLPPDEYADLVRKLRDIGDAEEEMRRHASRLAVILARLASKITAA